MKPGRIETYVHSDMTTANKGLGVFQLFSETDFAAKDEAFITVCKRAAQVAFVVGARSWNDLVSPTAIEIYDVSTALYELEVYLGEELTVGDIWSTSL